MDKTGKLVTRHVKADVSSGTTSTPIPPPSVATNVQGVVVLPEEKVTPVKASDFAMIAEVLEMCGSSTDDLANVLPYIQDGDLDAIRVYKNHGYGAGFTTVADVLMNTSDLFSRKPPADYHAAMDAHIKVASSGSFEYYEIFGVQDNVEVLSIIHENPDKADSIVSFLQSRGAVPDALKEYLANEVAALRDGTL